MTFMKRGAPGLQTQKRGAPGLQTQKRGATGLQTRGRRPGTVALVRALSKLGLASRKDAGALIVAGRVRVDGRVVRTPALAVIPEQIQIEIDGEAAPDHAQRTPRLVAFHKPRGTITTRRDPEGRPTVFDLLGDAAHGLVAIGRLDRASTGLLLFTNDTQLAHRLTDPKTRTMRRYVVTVRGKVDSETAARLEQGIDDLNASRVEIRKASNRETHLLVDLTEGKNREIRRLFAAVGHEVTRVHRIAFGTYELGDLQPGQWRDVSF